MVVSVSGTVPDSTLTPRQVRQKFSPQTLAGLGDCSYDDFTGEYTGDCGGSTTIDNTGGFYGTFNPPVTFDGSTSTQPDGTCWPFDPSCGGGTPVTTGATVNGGPYVDILGNIVTTYSDGTFSQISPSGKVTSGRSVVGSMPSSGSGSITQSQASAWPAMINALASAGVKLGTVAMLKPGQTLLPNGTVVGTGQSVFGTSVNSSFASILSNPMLLIGGFGIIALALFAGGGRR